MADLFMVDLAETDLEGANLSGAQLQGADLSGADLRWAIDEPSPESLPHLWTLISAANLEAMVFGDSPAALVTLREAFKKAGLRTQERQITYAIEHTKRLQAWGPSWPHLEGEDTRPWLERLAGKSESLFGYVFFEFPSDYGMAPGRAWQTLCLFIVLFSIPYMVAVTARGPAGIWMIWLPDGEERSQTISQAHFRGYECFYGLHSDVYAAGSHSTISMAERDGSDAFLPCSPRGHWDSLAQAHKRAPEKQSLDLRPTLATLRRVITTLGSRLKKSRHGKIPSLAARNPGAVLFFFESSPEKEEDMSGNSAQTTSIWMAATSSQSPLCASIHTDVCVVGAGISGMTTAYLLARQGKSVVVLDAGSIGGGETGRTTAHLSNALDDHYYELERLFGEKGARLAAASHTAAIDCIEAIVAEERIACDFERLDGYLFAPPEESKDVLDREIGAVHRAGLTDVEWVDRAPLEHFDTGRCLRFPRQGQFHPLKYLNGLTQAILRDGGQIFTGTRAEEIQGGSPAYIKTRGGPVITAGDVVVTTNTPINDPLIMHTKQYAYRTYAIGVHIPRGSVPKALYWDTPDPYHYVRIQSGDDGRQTHDLLIIGGEDHKVGEKDDGDKRFAELYRWAQRRFPMVQKTEYQWSGQILEPADGLAFIGRKPQGAPNVYIATGDSGHGLTHGTIAGILLTDLIFGRQNPWACLYDPLRLRSIATTDFLVENLSVLAHYADWLTGGEVSSAEEIKPGEGRILRRGLTKTAAYRDENGVLHERQAICQHLGCVVSWNSTEKSWDCPCHGARYDAFGRVLNGPANSNLVGGDK